MVTAYETVTREIIKMPFLHNKRLEVLIKPLRLAQLENSIINIANRK